MSHKRKSQNLKYDDPSAFYKAWPAIQKQGERVNVLGRTEMIYKMGKVRVEVTPVQPGMSGYFMSIRATDRYPTWDEIVWMRYNLIPDAARMVLNLPNLDSYINIEASDAPHGGQRFVFTMEQAGWAITPTPEHCDGVMQFISVEEGFLRFGCTVCHEEQIIDGRTWNEEHGHGLNGVVPAAEKS